MPYSVMLVDDDPRLTRSLTRSLAEEDYTFYSAESGPEALQILKEHPVDVVISDEQMPGMNGSELLSIVRDKHPDTVRIILTGQASLESAVTAINEGEIYRYLLKPCNVVEMAVTIRQALQHRQLLKKSLELMNAAKKQNRLLTELEKAHPGLSQVETNSDGLVVIDEIKESVEELIAEIDREIKNNGEFFSDWSCGGKGSKQEKPNNPETYWGP